MRYLLAFTWALLSAHVSVADDAPAIEWSPTRSLAWDDFLGSVPSDIDENRVAATSSSLAWSYRYTVEWSRNSCIFRIESIDSAALFHPDSSWARADHRTDAVLLHEQGHFDITQIYKNKFDRATRDFLAVSRACRGRTQRAASRDIEADIAGLVGSVFDETWQQYRHEQESYDRETRHGIDSDAQARWSGQLAARLQN